MVRQAAAVRLPSGQADRPARHQVIQSSSAPIFFFFFSAAQFRLLLLGQGSSWLAASYFFFAIAPAGAVVVCCPAGSYFPPGQVSPGCWLRRRLLSSITMLLAAAATIISRPHHHRPILSPQFILTSQPFQRNQSGQLFQHPARRPPPAAQDNRSRVSCCCYAFFQAPDHPAAAGCPTTNQSLGHSSSPGLDLSNYLPFLAIFIPFHPNLFIHSSKLRRCPAVRQAAGPAELFIRHPSSDRGGSFFQAPGAQVRAVVRSSAFFFFCCQAIKLFWGQGSGQVSCCRLSYLFIGCFAISSSGRHQVVRPLAVAAAS